MSVVGGGVSMTFEKNSHVFIIIESNHTIRGVVILQKGGDFSNENLWTAVEVSNSVATDSIHKGSQENRVSLFI